MKRGWTLHEMVVSLAVMGLVIGLTSHLAVGQLRHFRGMGDVAAVRSQVHEATTIVATALWGVSPSLGDVTFAADSALELRVPVGVAVVCQGDTGRALVAAPAPAGNALASFDVTPEAGDVASLLIADSLGSTWLRATVASPPVPGIQCPALPAAASGWRLSFLEPLVIPSGSVLRFTRPMRFNLYRSSDSRWYMGARDWNVAAARLNGVQPVAGPLDPYNHDQARTGLGFRYFDADGAELVIPFDPARIARVDVSARSTTSRPVKVAGLAVMPDGTVVDSITTTIAVRNRL